MNPSALVPTLIPIESGTGQPDESKVVCTSRCCVVHRLHRFRVWGIRGRLTPWSRRIRTRHSVAASGRTRRIESAVPHIMGFWFRKDDDERREHFRIHFGGIDAFEQGMIKNVGRVRICNPHQSAKIFVPTMTGSNTSWRWNP